MNKPSTTKSGSSARHARTWIHRIVQSFLWFVGGVVWLWCVGFLFFLDDNLPGWFAILAGLIVAIGIPVVFVRFRRTQPAWPWLTLAAVFTVCLVGFWSMKPTHDREWSAAQRALPFADLPPQPASGPWLVTVHNIRANRYGPVAPESDSHYDDTFDLSKLRKVWFGVDRFTSVEPLAHTFLSFEFEPGSHRKNYLAFSVETRREKDELTYSPIRGLFNNYEIIYVIADEEDVLSVRSDLQEHVVQLYPVRATPDQARIMFLDMLARTNEIHNQPEFYHTLSSNCTNNIVYHTNQVLEQPISAWQRGVIFPGYADWLAYRLGILDTDLPLDDAREEFRIDQRVKAFDGTSDFSDFIRGR